jgi:hypothetical protein
MRNQLPFESKFSFTKGDVMSKVMLFLATFLIAQNSFSAEEWSSCQTVTAVSDYRSTDDSVYFSIAPGLAGCTYGGIQRVRMTMGVLGMTADTLKGGLTMGLTALAMKVPVKFFYENSTITCNVRVIAVGGYGGECQPVQ